MKFRVSLVAAAVAGFVGLSYELLWYRVYSIANYARASSFPLLLAAYLLGLALGALAARAALRRRETIGSTHPIAVTAVLFQLTGAVAFVAVPLYADYCRASPASRWPWLGLVAAALGAIFPLVAQSGVPADDRAGPRVSYLYVANIAGSTLGSLLTGFVLMDVLSLRLISCGLLVFGAAAGTLLLLASGVRRAVGLALAGVTAIVVAGLCLASGTLYDRVYERLLYAAKYGDDFHFTHVVENKSGVIMVGPRDTVYGGGTYDGAFNIDLIDDPNGIRRAYFLGAVHRAPRNVLMIGLSTGSWAQVIAHLPGLEKLTIVEINSGYLDLLPRYPIVSSLLDNPKVEIIVDDGRRWLVRNPERRFDAIVANTVVHWVGSSTHILSAEFFALLRAHTVPGGVMCFNSTGSRRAVKSAGQSFTHLTQYRSFVCGSDAAIAPDLELWRARLSSWRIDGRPALEVDREEGRAALEQLLFEVRQERKLAPGDYHDVEPITDDNMGHEWDW